MVKNKDPIAQTINKTLPDQTKIKDVVFQSKFVFSFCTPSLHPLRPNGILYVKNELVLEGGRWHFPFLTLRKYEIKLTQFLMFYNLCLKIEFKKLEASLHFHRYASYPS